MDAALVRDRPESDALLGVSQIDKRDTSADTEFTAEGRGLG